MFGKLAELFVEIGAITKPLDTALAGVKGKLAALATRQFHIPGGGLLGTLGLVGGVGLAFGGVMKLVHAASDLNETVNASKQVFGESFGIVEKFTNEMADRFGLVRNEIYQASSSFGAIIEGAGFSTDEAAKLSTQLTKLAADLTSAKNIRFEESLEKIQAGLAGMARPLREYGVNILDSTVEQYALAKGLAKSKGEMTEQAKVMARIGLMTQGLGYANRDLDRTIGDYANATRAAEGRFENLAATLGTALLPAFKEFRSLLNQVLMDFTASHDGMTSRLTQFSNFLHGVIEKAGAIYRNWGLIIQRTGIMIVGWADNVGEVFTYVKNVISAFLNWFSTNWRAIFLDTFNATIAALKNLGQRFTDFGKAAYDWITSGFKEPFTFKLTPILDGTKMTTPELKLPKLELSSVEAQLKGIDRQMAENETKRLDGLKKEGVAGEEGKKKQILPDEQIKKEKKAEHIGLAEFAKKIQTGILEGKDNTSRRTATATERTAVGVETIARHIRRPPAAVAVGPA